MEAANWDVEKALLIDQNLGDLSCKLPVIWLKTKKDGKNKVEDEDDDDEEIEDDKYHYLCPMFKTSKRTSIISASGRSDEHIISINLNSKKQANYWIMRGVALITMLDN